MKKWATLTNDLKFCEIAYDGEWYRVKVSDDYGQPLMENESISLQGAKKQVKRYIGGDHKVKWKEIETDKLDITSKLNLPTGYLSVSQVRKYLNCPFQYELKYVHRMQETIGASLVMGRAFHKGMQMASLKKGMEGEVLTTDDVLDVYSDSFDYEIDNNDVEWKEDEDPGKLKDDGNQMLKKYYEEFGINAVPMIGSDDMPMVEKKHTFEIVPGLPVVTIIDIIEQDGIMRDYKTAKKSPSKNIIDDTIQMPVYALSYRDLTGERESGISLDYAVNLKREKKIMQLQADPVDDGRIERVKQTFVGVAKSISAGIFYPNEESNSCGYCSFKSVCKRAK
ncbi:CRISPR-associated protein [Bacillus phage vB_BpsM-61]|nr:CRISPR-associated protein [Bacillus phage vB_BpsM-61]